MTVYVVHDAKNSVFNLTPAKEYGDIKFVFSRDFSPSFYPAEAFAAAETWANEFDFERDHIVIAGGDPVAFGICIAALVKVAEAENRTEVNYLRYSRRRYTPGAGYVDHPEYVPTKLKIR